MKYQPIVGLEIHLQAKTKSKMFCRCDANYFGQLPNTKTCPVCLGLPGALPMPNSVALQQCIKLALALNCKINQHSKFDRKNYFYADLPKGYQISQYDLPIGYEGYLEFDIEGDSRRIRITRVHMEEDTAKTIYTEEGALVDFNKSGVPLIEVVTEPDFETVEEVIRFARRLKQTVEYLEISDADMEKGQMRFELNISLKQPGENGLPDYKVEVKNIGSISVLEKVINFEIERQSKFLDEGKLPPQENRGLKDMTGETVSQRSKETAADYRYFPEPDIPLLAFPDELIAEINSEIGILPTDQKYKYIAEYKLEPDTAETLIRTREQVIWFDSLIEQVKVRFTAQEDIFDVIKEAAKWFIGDVFGMMQAHKMPFHDNPISQSDLIDIVEMIRQKAISGTIAKNVLEIIFQDGGKVKDIIAERNLILVSDADAIKIIAEEVIAENPTVVADYTKNPNAIKFLVGQVMKKSKGKSNPKVAEEVLTILLNN